MRETSPSRQCNRRDVHSLEVRTRMRRDSLSLCCLGLQQSSSCNVSYCKGTFSLLCRSEGCCELVSSQGEGRRTQDSFPRRGNFLQSFFFFPRRTFVSFYSFPKEQMLTMLIVLSSPVHMTMTVCSQVVATTRVKHFFVTCFPVQGLSVGTHRK